MQHEARIKSTLEKLNCPIDIFALLAGVSQSRLSRAFRGLGPLTGPETIQLSGVVSELTRLAEDAQPYEISFKNPQVIRQLLEYRRNGMRWVTTVVGMAGEEPEQAVGQ